MKVLHWVCCAVICFAASCANKVTPRGGQVDKDAPVIKSEIPANFAVGFQAKEIDIQFDEYIQLKDLPAQLVISPPMDPKPEITAAMKSLKIRLAADLKEKTTYTINFGNSIVDLHEGNALPQYEYVFSTGDQLDSLYVQGKVMDAKTRNPLRDYLVMAYLRTASTTADTPGISRRPDYFARSAADGTYRIGHMPAGTYDIVALNDKNNNFLLDDFASETFAFQYLPIDVVQSEKVNLFAGMQRSPQTKLKGANRMDRGRLALVYNQRIDSVQLLPVNGPLTPVTTGWNVGHDTLFVYATDSLQDSIQFIAQQAQGSDTILLRFQAAEPKILPRYSKPRIVQSPEQEGPSAELVIDFPRPLLRLPDEVHVYRDSVKVKPDSVYWDATYATRLHVRYSWTGGKGFRVILPPGSAKELTGRSNDSLVFGFVVPLMEQCAELKIRIPDCAGKNLLLQLLNDKYEMLRQVKVIPGQLLTMSYLTPGPALLRLIDNLNGNNMLDGGDYLRKQMPESVSISNPLTLRANWELETTLSCPDNN